MATTQLNGPQIGTLTEVLQSAFNPNTFGLLLLHRLDKQVFNLAPMGVTYEETVSAVIQRANMEGWWDNLVLKAREANPGNAKLLTFSQQFGLSSVDQTVTRQELERMIKPENPLLDVNVWREQLGKLEAQVCRIEYGTERGRSVTGTGFLFGGPSVVMTNYHVMEPVIKAKMSQTMSDGDSAKPEKVLCRFDYKRTHDGSAVNTGVTYGLATDWFIDASESYPLDQEAPADRLDYALIRLASSVGKDTVGDKSNLAGEKRGFIPLPQTPFVPAPGSGLCILQHPSGEPMKLAIDDDGVMSANAGQTRLRYRNNTEGGSSGSPCFTFKWELAALHHSGDPNFDPAHKPTYNQGIPLTAIMNLLNERNVLAKLPDPED
jgi:hypothetical protein